jgi:RNA polymerase subunit RPABC4/transcription elongation factor Spt4
MQFPTELLNQIAVGLEVAIACLTALLVAFWVGLVVWTFRDIRARTRDLFAWLLATLLVLVTGPIGLLLYLLLRPRETLAQSYDRQLEEEALLRDITNRRACPSCQAVTEPDWLICPHCSTELRRACAGCGRALDLKWKACPYCKTPVAKASRGKRGRTAAEPVAAIPAGPDMEILAKPVAEIPAGPTAEIPAQPVSDPSAEPTAVMPAEPADETPAAPVAELAEETAA